MNLNTTNTRLTAIKNVTIPLNNIPANDIYTTDYSISSVLAVYGIVIGFVISTSSHVVSMRLNATADNNIFIRVQNLTSSTQSANITIYYL